MLFQPAPSIFPEKSIPCQALDPIPPFVIIFVFVPETVPMKKLLTLSLLLLFPLALSLAGNLRANLSFCTFWSPQDGPYIETYLSVEGQSLRWQKVADGFQATVEVTMIFKQDDKVANFGKYALHSPVLQDTSATDINIIDQQRFSLPGGEYTFEITLKDMQSDSGIIRHEQLLSIAFPDKNVAFSGIELLDNYTKAENAGPLTKSGFDLVPYVYNYYPEEINRVRFYAELYHTDAVLEKGTPFLLAVYVRSFETGELIKDLFNQRRETAAEVIPLLKELNIENLPSGNFELVLEARNQQNEVITQSSIFFHRINPSVQLQLKDVAALDVTASFVEKYQNADTLAEFIRSLLPISSQLERVFADKNLINAELGLMQQYFLNFWMERDALNPAQAWEDYYAKVRHVNHHFKTLIKKGYETDRGIVYLKYGPPNTIAESHHEPAAYPYEIWHYYELRNQRNKRFVFYTRDLITNDFELIHSDAMGELANYRWQVDVMRRTTDGYDLDQKSVDDHWGGRIDTYYRDPR